MVRKTFKIETNLKMIHGCKVKSEGVFTSLTHNQHMKLSITEKRLNYSDISTGNNVKINILQKSLELVFKKHCSAKGKREKDGAVQ